MQKPLPSDRRDTFHLGPRKRLLAALLSLVASVLRCCNAWFGPRAVGKKVVLLEPFGLGDIISLQPLLNCLLERGYQVVLCGNQAWRALYPPRAGFVWLDAGLPWGTHDEKAKYRFSAYVSPAFRSFLRQFGNEASGGIGVDTRGDIRSTIALYLARCSRVTSLSHYIGSDVRVPSIAAGIVPFSPGLRRWEMNMRFLVAIGAGTIPDSAPPPSFPHLKTSMKGGVIGIIPIAPWEGKLWVASRWAEVITGLRKEGFECQCLCGPGQEMQAREQAGDVAVTECKSIEDWARALCDCGLVVTLDTGPMHLADALGIPVVALFGCSILPLWAPSGPRSVVIAHQDEPEFMICQPVEKNSEIGRKAMERNSACEVLAAARNCLRACFKNGFASNAQKGD